MKDYEKTFDDFWKDLVCNKDGSLNVEQVKKELHDYSFILDQIPMVYCEVTGNILSKPNYEASTVIGCFHTHMEDLIDQAIKDYEEDRIAKLR